MAAVMGSNDIVVTSSVFTKHNGPGDFAWMCKQAQYQDAIFLCLENFVDMLTSDVPGGGSACLRDVAFFDKLVEGKCAVGIPTGWSKESGGFPVLDARTRSVIDSAFDRLCRVLQYYRNFVRVIYPADEDDPKLIGTRIFKGTLADTVKKYISMRIHALPQHVRLFSAPSLRIIYRTELEMLPHALQVQRIKILEFELRKKTPLKRPPPISGMFPPSSFQRTLR